MKQGDNLLAGLTRKMRNFFVTLSYGLKTLCFPSSALLAQYPLDEVAGFDNPRLMAMWLESKGLEPVNVAVFLDPVRRTVEVRRGLKLESEKGVVVYASSFFWGRTKLRLPRR